MRIPIEKVAPGLGRWLEVLHLDHLLDINNPVRAMLLFSCMLYKPWTIPSGIGVLECPFHLIGGCMFIFMCYHSATALFYFDDSSDTLQAKKKNQLAELERECGDVLTRANSQAKKFIGMISADLDDRVREHVDHMAKILGKLKQQYKSQHSPQARSVYERLVVTMAHHLHRLRSPAIGHFEKLITMSGRSRYLVKLLKQERQQSMVALLTDYDEIHGPHGNALRADTLMDEDSMLLSPDGIKNTASSLFTCDFTSMCPSAADELESSGRTSSVDRRLPLPTEADLQLVLKDYDNNLATPLPPEKLVLRPLRLVLAWFQKVSEKQSDPMTAQQRLHQEHQPDHMFSPTGVAYAADHSTAWVEELFMHLRKSPIYRYMIAGIIMSVCLCFYYLHMVITMAELLKTGACGAIGAVTCTVELLKNVCGIAAMVCYAASLSIVLMNVDRLDSVLQVHQEIQELEDFKRQVHNINASDLANESSSASMIENVLEQLQNQKKLVGAFFDKFALGASPQVQDFEDLEAQMATALAKKVNSKPPKPPTASAAAAAPAGAAPAGSSHYATMRTVGVNNNSTDRTSASRENSNPAGGYFQRLPQDPPCDRMMGGGVYSS